MRQRFYEAIHAARGVDEDDYDRDNITLFVGTWNMGEYKGLHANDQLVHLARIIPGNAPPPDKLDDWIPKNVYDMYFIGTQVKTFRTDLIVA